MGSSGNLDQTAPGKVTTAGDTVYATGDNTLTRLAIGNAGTVMSSTGSAVQWGLTLTNSITAGSTQTQAGATALTTMVNRVTVSGTNGDGVKLPTAIAGLEILIINDDSAQTIQVWPNTSDAINGGSANAVDAQTLAAGGSRRYAAIDATNWYTISDVDVSTNAVGVLPYNLGGTAQSSFAQGDIIYASGANTLAKLAKGSDDDTLMMNGNVPNWEAVSGGVSVSGTPANNQLAIWTDSSTLEGDSQVLFDGTTLTLKGAGTGTNNNFLITDSSDVACMYVKDNKAVYLRGDVAIVGALSKGSGSFNIDHPLPALKDTHNLVHSFIEGPKADLIYRGSVELVDGSAEIDLDEAAGMTSGTWVLLCRDEQVFTSNETGWNHVRGSVSGATLSIQCEESDCTDTVSWMVVAERRDQHMLDTDWTDEDGRPIIEPEKPEEE